MHKELHDMYKGGGEKPWNLQPIFKQITNHYIVHLCISGISHPFTLNL